MGTDMTQKKSAGTNQSKAVCQGHLFYPLTLTESQMIISAEIQLETLSAYVSSCWRDRSARKPSYAERLLPSAGRDTFLLGNHGTDSFLCLFFCLYYPFYIVLYCNGEIYPTVGSIRDLLSALFTSG